VDVAVAIATGPAVAQVQSPMKVKLSNRLDRKRLAIVLEEDKEGGVHLAAAGQAAHLASRGG
jgi:hypothetical protein